MNNRTLTEEEIEQITNKILERDKINKNITLQKYYSLKRFLKSLEKDNFTFQEPSTWEDPFEDFISKLTNTHKDAIYNSFDITEGIFAMSTINKRNECDGMWSNFAQKNGVLVHIKIKKLLVSIIKFILDRGCCSDKNNFFHKLDIQNQILHNIKVIKIDYITDEEIAKVFRTITKTENMNFDKLSFRMLSIKRKEFEYENEYRIFIRPKLLNLIKTRFLPVGYFKETLEKIVLSPRASINRETRLKSIIRNKYGVSPSIEKSNLYNIEYFKSIYNL